jgi:MoaA/NifB/PqqE/SkfB family radical SAM enzyme
MCHVLKNRNQIFQIFCVEVSEMACIEKIYSVSALIGNGKCNANCNFCAAKSLKKDAYLYDSPNFWRSYESAIKLSARYGGWSLSLTSTGEPTVDPNSVTKALQIYSKCAQEGAYMPFVNLFTNGIKLCDSTFCKTYLPEWQKLGLTNVAVSIHHPEYSVQRQVYGLPQDLYHFEDIIKNVKEYGNGIGVRATLLLQRGYIEDARSYESAIKHLIYMGYNNITSWPIGNPDGTRNEFTPSWWNLFGIKRWLNKNAKLCHGHAWSGGVYDYHGNILRLTDYVTRHDPKKNFVRQLVVFQDGTIAYSWIKEGALCMK